MLGKLVIIFFFSSECRLREYSLLAHISVQSTNKRRNTYKQREHMLVTLQYPRLLLATKKRERKENKAWCMRQSSSCLSTAVKSRRVSSETSHITVRTLYASDVHPPAALKSTMRTHAKLARIGCKNVCLPSCRSTVPSHDPLTSTAPLVHRFK